MKTLIIKGSPESGKTSVGKLFEDNNTIYLDGRIKIHHFFFSSCEKETKTIIIDNIKNKKLLKNFKSIIINRGEIVVEKQCQSPFQIKIDRLILICDFL
jgi:broad-specificity NMP kinase